MAKKDEILNILLDNAGNNISGEEIARALDISRAYVWKAVNELREAGYAISGTSSKGYVLKKDGRLSAHEIEKRLKTGWRVSVLDSVSSTNDVAKKAAAAGEAEHGVFAATEQTAGRGRRGRSFFSEQNGVYFSFILRPKTSARDAVRLTCAAGVAVCRAIEALTDKKPLIKWVNDILIDGKKVCGILTEGATDLESGTLEYAVVGIGINTGESSLPEELRAIADTVGEVDKNALVAEVINNFDESADENTMAEYKARSAVIGKDIIVPCKNGVYSAAAIDIDGGGRLIIRDSMGNMRALDSGEISVKLEQK